MTVLQLAVAYVMQQRLCRAASRGRIPVKIPSTANVRLPDVTQGMAYPRNKLR
jgi:hypothetical protein